MVSPRAWLTVTVLIGAALCFWTASTFASIDAPWDVDGDGVVNIRDAEMVGAYWGWTGTPGAIPEDIARRGVVNVVDVVIIGNHWMETVGGPTATPTPTLGTPYSQTPSPTASATPSATLTLTASPTTTLTLTLTPTPTQPATATSTLSPTSTPTATATVTASTTPTASPTSTSTSTSLPTSTATPTGTVPAETHSTLWLLPSSRTVERGEEVNVSVTLYVPSPTRGLQFGVQWDRRVLDLRSYELGSFYLSWARAHGASVLQFPQWQLLPGDGGLTVGGVALLGGPSTGGPTGSGRVVVFHFIGTAEGTSPVTFTAPAVVEIGRDGKPIIDSDLIVVNTAIVVEPDR